MDPQDKTHIFNEAFRRLKIIHFAIFAGQLGFLAVVFILKNSEELILNLKDTSDPLFIVIPILCLSGLFASGLLFKKTLSTIPEAKEMKAKLGKYQTASIIKYALIEGPALLSIVALMLSGNTFFLILAVLMIIYFFMQKPKESQIREIIGATDNYNTGF